MIRQIVRTVVSLGCTAVALPSLAQGAPAPLPEASGSAIGYSTVADALAALHTEPGVTFSTRNGWTIAQDMPHQTIWSFAPADHAAYPSAVKRSVAVHDGEVSIETKVLCQASKAACDDLVRQFDAMNRPSR